MKCHSYRRINAYVDIDILEESKFSSIDNKVVDRVKVDERQQRRKKLYYELLNTEVVDMLRDKLKIKQQEAKLNFKRLKCQIKNNKPGMNAIILGAKKLLAKTIVILLTNKTTQSVSRVADSQVVQAENKTNLSKKFEKRNATKPLHQMQVQTIKKTQWCCRQFKRKINKRR